MPVIGSWTCDLSHYYEPDLKLKVERILDRLEEARVDLQTAFPLAMRIADNDPVLANKIDDLRREINLYLRGTSEDE